MEMLTSKITRLEEEVTILRKERDKFRKLATDAEAEIAKRRVAYLNLEDEYEKERRRRVNLELSLPGDRGARAEITTAVPEVMDVDVHEVPGTSSTIQAKKVPNSPRVKKDESKDIKVKLSPSTKHTITKKFEASIEHAEESEHGARSTGVIAHLYNSSTEPSHIPSGDVGTPSPRARRSVRAASRLPTTMSERQINLREDACISISPPPIIRPALPLTNKPSRPVTTPSKKMQKKSEEKLNDEWKTDPTAKVTSADPHKKTETKSDHKSEGGWTLNPTQASTYLEGTIPFVIHPSPINVAVSRKALTEKYGLPGMGLLWTSKDEQHRFLIPTYGVNPEMPRSPGEPGLLLSCREEMCEAGPWTLFFRVEGLKIARMDYAGEYMCNVVGEMSGEEFAAQAPSVKVAWGDKISKHKKYLPYRNLRARMTLRKMFNREPTEKQVQEEANLIKIKGYTSPLTSADVIAAFERGDEKISIVKLVCVSYSHRRAKDYAKAQVECEEKEMEKAVPAGGKGKRKRQTKSAHTNSKKRKVSKDDDSKANDSEDDGDDRDYYHVEHDDVTEHESDDDINLSGSQFEMEES